MKLLVLIGLLSVAITSHADAFKCTGDNGRTVYQEQPCEKSNLKEIGKIKPPPESSKEERDRMQAVQEKNKANLDANMEARAKREEKRIEEQKAATQSGQDEEGATATPKSRPQPQKSNSKEKAGNNS